ncbi:MAG: DUF4097 domain-containing protein [Myxococcales bacterium FL481]|nr:MAG: DUF4097 domain-containing protein [Myxococcales bacterium FL481]
MSATATDLIGSISHAKRRFQSGRSPGIRAGRLALQRGAVAQLALVACAALLVVGLSGCGHSCEGSRRQGARIEQPIESVVVDIRSGHVAIRGAAVDHVLYEARINGGEELDVDVLDTRLRLEQDESSCCPCSIDIDITVPEGTEVIVDTGAGDIDVLGFTGDLTASTGSGGIQVADYRGANLTLDTGAGTIDAVRLYAQSLTAESSSGRVTAEFEESPIDADLGSGAGTVSLTAPSGRYFVDARTGAGDIEITGIEHDPNAERRLVLRSASGDVVVRGK